MASEQDTPPESRLPNLVIVGVAKAGTTSLFHYLSQHPEICTSDVKELRYFSPLQYGEPLTPIDTYAQHFAHCQQQKYAVEATPGYFYGGRPLASGLRGTCPSARTLVVLRSPEARCWSFFRFVKSRVRIPKEMTFSAYLDRCEELHLAGTDMDPDHGDFSGLVKGCYAQWLDDWTEEFEERFRIMFFEDLVSDPHSSVKSICTWLDIDTAVVDTLSFAVDNKTEQFRGRLLQRGMIQASRRSQRLFHRHQTIKRLLRNGYYALNGAPSQQRMSPSDHERLTNFYRPHNAKLAGQLATLGMSLPASWSAQPDLTRE